MVVSNRFYVALTVLALAGAIVLARPSRIKQVEILKAWDGFRHAFVKNYSDSNELLDRKKNFEKNYLDYLNHNQNSTQHEFTYKKAINKFSDMTPDEFKQKYLGYRPRNLNRYHRFTASDLLSNGSNNTDESLGSAATSTTPNLPSKVDWRSSIVNPIRNQLDCGSCYAFSAVATLEGAYMKTFGHAVNFSEQYLIECARVDGNYRCDGGDEDATLYFMQDKGAVLRSSWPYTGLSHTRGKRCNASYQYQPTKVVVIEPLASNSSDESALKRAVAEFGVVSVAIDATNLYSYSSGIFNGPCETDWDNLNHAVNIVGYDEDAPTPYWILRNSWDTDWGINGYFYMPMNSNACGLNQDRSYAVY